MTKKEKQEKKEKLIRCRRAYAERGAKLIEVTHLDGRKSGIANPKAVKAVMDAITVERAVTLDNSCAVTVTLKGGVKMGAKYALLTVPSGELAGKSFALTLTSEIGDRTSAKLVTSDTTLSLEILSQGTVLIMR